MKSRSPQPKEYKVVALRECPTPESLQLCTAPEHVADYWNRHIQTALHFQPECECLAVLMLNARRRIKGHHLVSIGTLDTIVVTAREAFRAAVIAGAAAVILAHNHPSGDPSPSEGDIKVTRELIRAGQVLKIEVLDHLIVGQNSYCSLRALGYFF
jgi:DNA repair protein RadC